ncbi:S-adenosyl-L-methionine-dependent methyltransferase [Fimicolochytrium jonesii]|uniref:S-adenosyl-L-methionine-dependent methyltransferase n=1 Tax=Fimicolochytrium jonesii TaxID=1396493 RepID=UPI0022FE83A6|nr:S-adenosyl-L-methionine-dependent methyltransferase [Fimicolochytrium jonesii]KAI8825690.1 S-adenosyl-L-methionine-dependent methyltransferase [Fimicolochytrium jonesii]
MPKYLVHFAQLHADFRLPELDSLAVLENVKLTYEKSAYSDEHPFLVVECESDDEARKLIRRSILTKQIIRLVATAPTYDEVLEVAKRSTDLIDECRGKSFKFELDAFGRTFDQETQIARIEPFCFLPCGDVNLKNPEITLAYIEDYGHSETAAARNPERAFFGVLVGRGDRGTVTKYDLKKRQYLGTTSMDAELSLVMANQALVRAGSFVLDPFVGTGSFLVTCAHYGCFTMGTDIDGRQIRGKGERSIRSNVEQYKLGGRVLDTVVADIAHHPWRATQLWDAIVCDVGFVTVPAATLRSLPTNFFLVRQPPYGVRAGAKKLGFNANAKPPPGVDGPLPALKKNGELRYPSTIPYEMHDVIVDLIDFAAVHLVPGGRLVYWLPTIVDEYSPDDLPLHPQFKLVSNSAQVFGKWCRRLVTMEKLHDAGSLETGECQNAALAEAASANPAHAKFREVYFGDGRT